jgi:THO complex subunit 2
VSAGPPTCRHTARLAKDRRRVKEDGVNISDWLQALAKFTGIACRCAPLAPASASRPHNCTAPAPALLAAAQLASALFSRPPQPPSPPLPTLRRRFSDLDVGALLSFLANTLRRGEGAELEVLQQMVTAMTVRAGRGREEGRGLQHGARAAATRGVRTGSMARP